MRNDNLYTAEEARDKQIEGIRKVAGAVKVTLGAAGSNVIIESDLRPFHRITNDGVTIANSIYLVDPVENIAANLIKEVANRSDKESGDGTTTTVTLLEAIVNEGQNSDAAPMEIKRSLDECLPLIIEAIDAQKREITVDEVGQVASISAEDESIGALIQEAYQNIGADGIIELDNSNLPETFLEYTEGVRLRFAGWLGAYSSTEPGKAIYKNPKILISKEKITSVDQIEGLFKGLDQEGISELVMYVEDIDVAVSSRLALTHLNGGFKTLIIKAPTLWKDWLYEDFAKLTGATPVDFAEGKTFKNLTMKDLGTCDKIITTKDETRVLGTKDVTEHIAELEAAGKLDDQQKVRASWLQTKVAILKLGANSDVELSYKRLKAIDAIGASKLALEDGTVPGGGIALYTAKDSLPDTVGGNILRVALGAPLRQIMQNAGSVVSWENVPEGDKEIGFDAKTRILVNMWDAGIIDPAKVVKNAVTNAISVAGIVLTAKAVVTLPRQDTLTEVLQQTLKPESAPAYV